MDVRVEEKHCVGCTLDLPSSEFYESSTSPDGLNRYCIQCCKVNRALEAVRKRDKKSKISFRQQYRAIQLGVEFDEGITLVEVFRRDRGICRECSLWVQPGKASMDHVKPLARGGTHTWGNIALTHFRCNLRKGYRDDG